MKTPGSSDSREFFLLFQSLDNRPGFLAPVVGACLRIQQRMISLIALQFQGVIQLPQKVRTRFGDQYTFAAAAFVNVQCQQ